MTDSSLLFSKEFRQVADRCPVVAKLFELMNVEIQALREEVKALRMERLVPA